MRGALIATLALILAGCSAQVAVAAPTERDSSRPQVQRRFSELLEIEATVAAALDREACEADLCPSALRICELADQICEIAGRHAGDRELTSRCADSRGRCDRVTARVDAACGC